MFKIAVANEKGGVAKTTTVISLAAGLSELGNHVALMDLDPQGNLALSLGIQPVTSAEDALSSFEGLQFIETVAKPTEYSNISFIPVFSKGFPSEGEKTSFYSLQRLLGYSDNSCDFLLMDCPPQLGFMTNSAIIAADLLIIPTQAEYFSIYALKTMIHLIKNARENGNANLTYKLLLTMYDKRNRIHTKMMEELRSTFGTGVFDTCIEIDTKLRESQVAGTPILFHLPSSRASNQYRALSQEIMSYVQAKNIKTS